MCVIESHTLVHTSKLVSVHCNTIGLVRGLWLLLFPGYWAITGSALGYHIAALCHRDPVALDLQVWPHPMLQQFIDLVDVGVAQVVDQVLDLGGSWIGQPASFPSPSVPGRTLQHSPGSHTR